MSGRVSLHILIRLGSPNGASVMKSFLASLWQRRGRRLLCIGLIVCALPLLHPFVRQSIFGPTIRNKPWCVWEGEVRRKFAEPHGIFADQRNVARRFLLPERAQKTDAELFDHDEMLPLVIALLDDADPQVRGACLSAISQFPKLQDRSALPALRKKFHDDTLHNRLLAGRAIWPIEKDKEVVKFFVATMKQPGEEERLLATNYAVALAADAPELFSPLVANARDDNQAIRSNVMHAMPCFGKKGVPVLIDGLRDSAPGVRSTAVIALMELGPEARDAIPALEAGAHDRDSYVAGLVRSALRKVDPDRKIE